MTTTTSMFGSIASVFSITVDPQVCINKAVAKAHSRITRRYRATDPAMFDKAFLHGNGAPIIAAFVDGTQVRHLAAGELSRAWNVDLGRLSAQDRGRRLVDTTMIADSFLTELSKILYA